MTGPTLEAVELRRVRLPLIEPWRWPGGVLTDREVILIRAVGPHSEGWGECSALPTPAYSPEWTDGAWDVLRRFLAPRLVGGPLDGASVAGALAGVRGHHMARSGIELAVLDAELRAAGVSLARRLGGTRSRVTAGVAVGLAGSLPELLAEVGRWVSGGYRRVKLKIRPGWDLDPVMAVREAFPGLALQVDANAGYRLTDAGHLSGLDAAGLLCLEQPLGVDDLLGHAELGGRMTTPLCLDEAITSTGAAAAAIALGACRVVNIKPGRVGGYLEAVRVHDLCARRGVPVWCGGMLETGVGRCANLALASLPNFSLPGDLSASGRFYREDVTDPVVLAADGTIAVPEAPGTGAILRADVLDAATVDRACLSPG